MDSCLTSKPALVILIWTFAVNFTYEYGNQALIWNSADKNPRKSVIKHAIVALVLCFSPLAGYLADVKCGRYKVITRSMYTITTAIILAVLLFVLQLLVQKHENNDEYRILFSLVVALGLIMALAVVSFQANIIQFGMDQLYDSPSNHQSLFVHWYLWAFQLSECTIMIITMISKMIFFKFPRSFEKTLLLNIFGCSASIFLLTTSVCIACTGKRMFFVDFQRSNPYRLVYRVTRFACLHRVPIRRSAFTYCEDTIPSGLDLGKTKYGGPFTTEQVEDVKVLYGILKVLVAIGPTFLMDVGNDHLINFFYRVPVSNETNYVEIIESTLFMYGLFSSLLRVITIPVYIYLIRPYIYDCVPGMLKCIGFGVFLMTATAASMLAIDTAEHWNHRNETCCFLKQSGNNITTENSPDNSIVLIVPRTLIAFSTQFFYIALYEFICSQSPHTMKGMLIGLSLALKGVFELLGIVMVIVFADILPSQSFPSCGMEYYIMNVLWGVISLVIFTHFSRKYKYRVRDELCPVYHYAEEYYSKIEE